MRLKLWNIYPIFVPSLHGGHANHLYCSDFNTCVAEGGTKVNFLMLTVGTNISHETLPS